jgi:hypothetical protein
MAQNAALTADEAQPAAGGAAAAPAGFHPRYLFALLAGGALALFALLAMVATAQHLGRLPPPAFANSLCMDEKLLDLRDRHGADTPSLLAVGSSVAWRHFDGGVLVQAEPGTRPLNAGFCGLRITQTAYVLEWLLRRYPSAREVVAVVAPQDFQSCIKPEVPVFDTAVAEEFFERRAWSWSWYLRFFSFSFVANAAMIKESREAWPGIGPLFHDAYGAAPIDPFAPMPFVGLYYGPLTDLDAGCFAALRRMALHVAEGGRRLVVATTPLHPEWVERHGEHGAVPQEFSRRLVEALAGTGAVFWDGHAAMGIGGEEFTDAIHLRWKAAERFSRALAAATHLGHAVAQAGILNVKHQ